MSPSLFLHLMEEGNSLYKGQSWRMCGTQGVVLSAECPQAWGGGCEQVLSVQSPEVMLSKSNQNLSSPPLLLLW